MRKAPGMLAAREALLAQLGKAAAGLRRHTRADPAIHDIRKALKRARAALRLLRRCLGEAAYRWDNTLVREAARPLTSLRDAKVLLDALRHWDRHGKAHNLAAAVSLLGSALSEEYQAAQRHLTVAQLEHAAEVLTAIRRRALALAPRKLSGQSAGGAIKRAYRVSRHAFERARARSTDERLHEWRKQTLYFANQLEILLPLDLPHRFAKGHKRAARLAEHLGEDHDLALLARRMSQLSTPGGTSLPDDTAASMIAPVARRRRKLQRRCFRLGTKLHADKASRYAPPGL